MDTPLDLKTWAKGHLDREILNSSIETTKTEQWAICPRSPGFVCCCASRSDTAQRCFSKSRYRLIERRLPIEEWTAAVSDVYNLADNTQELFGTLNSIFLVASIQYRDDLIASEGNMFDEALGASEDLWSDWRRALE